MANPPRLILFLLLNAITTIRVVFSQNYTEIKLKQLDDNKLSFGPIVTVTTENHDEMKCQYYNITTCHGRQQIGCGDTSQICNAPDNSNSTTNMCYALWRNEPLGRRQIISKGCWRGDMTDCRPPGPEFLKYGSAEKCIHFDNGRGPPNRTQFCCCYGRECNEEVHSVVVPCHANSTSILCDEEVSTVKHHNALLFIAVILFAIIGGLIVYYLICKIWYDKRRKEEEEKSDCSTDDEMSSEVMRSETSDSISILTENWILLTDSITELDKLDLL